MFFQKYIFLTENRRETFLVLCDCGTSEFIELKCVSRHVCVFFFLKAIFKLKSQQSKGSFSYIKMFTTAYYCSDDKGNILAPKCEVKELCAVVKLILPLHSCARIEMEKLAPSPLIQSDFTVCF